MDAPDWQRSQACCPGGARGIGAGCHPLPMQGSSASCSAGGDLETQRESQRSLPLRVACGGEGGSSIEGLPPYIK